MPLPFCRVYKGEEELPEEYKQKPVHLMWLAEFMICNSQYPPVTQQEFEQKVEAYMATWAPYESKKIYKEYLSLPIR